VSSGSDEGNQRRYQRASMCRLAALVASHSDPAGVSPRRQTACRDVKIQILALKHFYFIRELNVENVIKI
jgi:hypothetical protein